MTLTCKCGFLFVTDSGHNRPVDAICPKCGARVTLDPAALDPASKPVPKKGGDQV